MVGGGGSSPLQQGEREVIGKLIDAFNAVIFVQKQDTFCVFIWCIIIIIVVVIIVTLYLIPYYATTLLRLGILSSALTAIFSGNSGNDSHSSSSYSRNPNRHQNLQPSAAADFDDLIDENDSD